jgi:hypothetical protein
MKRATADLSWANLAMALGVSKRSLERWRATFGDKCPQTRDLATWRRFMVVNCLKRADESLAPDQLAAIKRGGPMPQPSIPHSSRFARERLFDLLETNHEDYADGKIDLEQYSQIGAATVEYVIEVGKILDAGIDADGYRQNWRAILATAATKKAAANRLSAR